MIWVKQDIFIKRMTAAFRQNAKSVQELIVDADYLPTLQIKLESGRNFSDQFSTDSANSVLVNEALVKELGWTHPIGMKIQKVGKTPAEAKTVIGVFRDFHTYSLQHKVQPLVLVLPSNVNDEDNLYVRLAKGKSKQALAYLDQVYKQFRLRQSG